MVTASVTCYPGCVRGCVQGVPVGFADYLHYNLTISTGFTETHRLRNGRKMNNDGEMWAKNSFNIGSVIAIIRLPIALCAV